MTVRDNNSTILTLVVIILLIVAGIMFFKNYRPADRATNETTVIEQQEDRPESEAGPLSATTPSPATGSPVLEVTVSPQR